MGELMGVIDLDESEFIRLPMIVEVMSGHERRAYGPFISGLEAQEWCDRQYKDGFTGSFSLIPLRTPDRQRSYADWWTPDRLLGTDHIREEFGICPAQTNK
jgi:hypothetical protein